MSRNETTFSKRKRVFYRIWSIKLIFEINQKITLSIIDNDIERDKLLMNRKNIVNQIRCKNLHSFYHLKIAVLTWYVGYEKKSSETHGKIDFKWTFLFSFVLRQTKKNIIISSIREHFTRILSLDISSKKNISNRWYENDKLQGCRRH